MVTAGPSHPARLQKGAGLEPGLKEGQGGGGEGWRGPVHKSPFPGLMGKVVQAVSGRAGMTRESVSCILKLCRE